MSVAVGAGLRLRQGRWGAAVSPRLRKRSEYRIGQSERAFGNSPAIRRLVPVGSGDREQDGNRERTSNRN